MRIRDANGGDLPAITRLYQAIEHTTWEYTEEPHTLEERAVWLSERRSSDFPVLVAELDGSVIGVATYGDFRDSLRWPGYRVTVEHTVHVDAAYRQKGVGRALMTALMRRAADAGARVIVAGIDSSNAGSIAFHARLGFRETARMPGVGEKWGRRLDLVLMQRDLDPPRG